VDNKTFDSFVEPTTFAYDLAGQLVTSVQGGYVTTYTYDANGNQTNQQLPWQKTTMSYDKENRMATFAEDATLNTYTYDSDGFKKVENVGGSL
jgi:YD repeat-containing protein